MTGFTNWFRVQILEAIRGTDLLGLTETWVSLLTALPSIDPVTASGTDETEWSVARKQVNLTGPTQPFWDLSLASDDGVWLINDGAVVWSTGDTTALSSAVTIVGVAVYDASTAGQLIAYDEILPNIVVNPSDPVSFASQKLKVQDRSIP